MYSSFCKRNSGFAINWILWHPVVFNGGSCRVTNILSFIILSLITAKIEQVLSEKLWCSKITDFYEQEFVRLVCSHDYRNAASIRCMMEFTVQKGEIGSEQHDIDNAKK